MGEKKKAEPLEEKWKVMHISLSPLDKGKLGGSNENEQNQVDIERQDGFTGRMRKFRFRTDKAEGRISLPRRRTLESSLSLNSTDSCFSWGSWTGVVRISGLSLFTKVQQSISFVILKNNLFSPRNV